MHCHNSKMIARVCSWAIPVWVLPGRQLQRFSDAVAHLILMIRRQWLMERNPCHLSRLVTKPTKWSVCPAKTQISLGIHPVWSESSQCTEEGSWGANVSSCRQQRLWSDWSDAQADLSFCWAHMSFCWLCHEAAHIIWDCVWQNQQNDLCAQWRLRSIFYIGNFMPLASFCSWADWFESYLFKNPEDRFSRDEVQIVMASIQMCLSPEHQQKTIFGLIILVKSDAYNCEKIDIQAGSI